MKSIASRDNPTYQGLRRVMRRGPRVGDDIAHLEGAHLCGAFLDAGAAPRRCVVSRSMLGVPEVAAIVARVASADVLALDDALFAGLSALDDGGGLLFEIDVPRAAMPERIERTAVLLDRVQDPGNVGSILRSAAAAGIGAVYASKGCAALWGRKVVRAGMGAHFHLALVEGCDLLALRERTALRAIATSSHATTSLHALALDDEVLWMFGHEGGGLDPALVDGAIEARIPQRGEGESLNVAAAAAVCFFEQVRQRNAVIPAKAGT